MESRPAGGAPEPPGRAMESDTFNLTGKLIIMITSNLAVNMTCECRLTQAASLRLSCMQPGKPELQPGRGGPGSGPAGLGSRNWEPATSGPDHDLHVVSLDTVTDSESDILRLRVSHGVRLCKTGVLRGAPAVRQPDA